MRCSSEFPLTANDVIAAKAHGLNKTNAPSFLDEKIPSFDHKPVVQSMMDKGVQSYRSPCWLSGMCREKSKLRQSSALLHRSLLQQIKQQLRGMLPSSSVKDALISGDIAVAIRFPEASSAGASSSSSSAPPPLPRVHCRVFLLSKVVLRPEYAVMMEMDVDMDLRIARLRKDQETGLATACSFDAAHDLLTQFPAAASASMWVNVLRHKPLLPG